MAGFLSYIRVYGKNRVLCSLSWRPDKGLESFLIISEFEISWLRLHIGPRLSHRRDHSLVPSHLLQAWETTRTCADNCGCCNHQSQKEDQVIKVAMYALCAHWCTHFSARRRRHISKTHFCQGGYVNEDAKTHFEDTLNEDEFPPEDELPREDTFRRHIKRRRISPRRRITSRRQISKTH